MTVRADGYSRLRSKVVSNQQMTRRDRLGDTKNICYWCGSQLAHANMEDRVASRQRRAHGVAKAVSKAVNIDR